MDKPVIASLLPYPLPVKKGETVHWCACGLSNSQPFCDGSHNGTGFSPEAYTPQKDCIVFFCGCKRSKRGMVCDGSHIGISEQ